MDCNGLVFRLWQTQKTIDEIHNSYWTEKLYTLINHLQPGVSFSIPLEDILKPKGFVFRWCRKATPDCNGLNEFCKPIARSHIFVYKSEVITTAACSSAVGNKAVEHLRKKPCYLTSPFFTENLFSNRDYFLSIYINPLGNYMLKVNNRYTRTRCGICSKLLITKLTLNIFHTLF